MADSPTVVVVGGSGEPPVAQPEPQSDDRAQAERAEAVQLGQVLESNRQLSETVQAQSARLESLEAREQEHNARLDAMIALQPEPEPEPDVTLITPEPEPPPAEPEPEPEVQKKECPRWLKPFLAEK